MTTFVEFTYPRAGLVNANDRLHYRPKANKVAQMRAWARDAAKRYPHDNWPLLARQNVRVYYQFTNLAAVRDIGNLQPSSKAFLDGCVEAGMLLDDNDKCVEGPDNRLDKPDAKLDKTLVHVVIRLDPIPDRAW
jgi:hypothetical protein